MENCHPEKTNVDLGEAEYLLDCLLNTSSTLRFVFFKTIHWAGDVNI